MEVPVKDKVELLMAVNAAAHEGRRQLHRTRCMFQVNEQKYFASTDGSYIDQDIHRIWAPFTVTAIDKASGKFRTRDGLSSPMGMGYEYLDARRRASFELPGGVVMYSRFLRHGRRRHRRRAAMRRTSSRRRRSSRASTTWCSIRTTCS